MSSANAWGSSKRAPGSRPATLRNGLSPMDARVYPPCPNLLAPSPASDFYSGHARSLRFSCCLEILARRSRVAFALLRAVLMSRNCLLG
jgi:hypothetical protein